MLHLPQTLASLQTSDLAEVLLRELPESQLPLERYTTQGGWPEAAQMAVRGVRDEVNHAVVLLTVQFTERVPAACPSSARPEIRVAYLALRIARSTAEAEIIDDS